MEGIHVRYFAYRLNDIEQGYLFAMGTTPRADYRVGLRKEGESFRFDYEASHSGATVVTPFEVSVPLDGAAGMRSTTVVDASGEHQVQIHPVPAEAPSDL